MKKMIALLILTISASAAANDSNGLLNDKRTIQTRLQIEKKKLVEQLAVELAKTVVLTDEVEFIEDYASGELNMADIEALVTSRPVASNGAFAAAVYAAAKVFNEKIVNPALNGTQAEETLIVKLMKRYPKLSKRGAYTIATIATASSIYFTIQNSIHYAQLVEKTQAELDAMYLQKNSELITARNEVVRIERELFGINMKLNEFNVAATNKIYTH